MWEFIISPGLHISDAMLAGIFEFAKVPDRALPQVVEADDVRCLPIWEGGVDVHVDREAKRVFVEARDSPQFFRRLPDGERFSLRQGCSHGHGDH